MTATKILDPVHERFEAMGIQILAISKNLR